MTGLEQAILALNEEIAEFHQGTPQQPDAHSADWFRLRALNLGRTYLLRVQQLEIHGDPGAAERFHAACDKMFKLTSVPAEPVVEREVLPAGTASVLP
jgi:hypothetical protein